MTPGGIVEIVLGIAAEGKYLEGRANSLSMGRRAADSMSDLAHGHPGYRPAG
jgi:hypothetical protein